MDTKTAQLMLKPGREAAVLRRHPWVFSGSVARVTGSPAPGDLVSIASAKGEFLAWGHYSPHSQIRVRLVSWKPEPQPDTPDFWRRRLQRAVDLRAPLITDTTTTAYRLIYADSDGVPGLIADRYNDTLVVQYLTAGVEQRRELFTELLWEVVGQRMALRTLFERSDVDARHREGLKQRTGLLRGGPPPEHIRIREHGLVFSVDVRGGHKTGCYLDQRENRWRLRRLIEKRAAIETAPTLLNVFAYTGSFAIYGLAAGARNVVNIDTSADALELGRTNLEANDLDPTQSKDIVGDAFEVLRDLRQEGQTFDVIVLDPPKFAFTQRDVQSAARGYKDINMQASHLLRSRGLLLTFSCSGAVSDELFQKIVFSAALDARRNLQIIGRMIQGPDHPIALTFPEGAYLKGLVCQAVDEPRA